LAKKLEEKKHLLPQTKPIFFLKEFFNLILITGIMYGLILKGKHLSTLIISGLTLLSILFAAKIKLRTIIISCLVVVLSALLVLSFGSKYRSNRLNVYYSYSLFYRLLNKEAPPIEADDLQVKESITALSNGGFFGRGSEGGMAKFKFLPEAKTDYVFSILGEQYGFAGAVTIFLLYVIIFYRSLFVSSSHQSFFYFLTGIGLALNIFLNVVVNIGVAMSALPSTGVTLPFISYGGTSFLINSFSIGMLLNISARSKLI